jgi:hypothetical protein
MKQYDDYNTIWDGDDCNPYTPCGNCGADCKASDLDENGVCADCAEAEEVIVTKGDMIRQTSNTDLALAMFRLAKCEECPCDKTKCRCIRTAACLDNWTAYFNSPADEVTK